MSIASGRATFALRAAADSIVPSVATSFRLKTTTRSYWLITALPGAFMAVTTLTTGVHNVTDNYLPMARAGSFNGYLNAALTLVVMLCAMIVTTACAIRRVRAMRQKGDGQLVTSAPPHACAQAARRALEPRLERVSGGSTALRQTDDRLPRTRPRGVRRG